MRPIITQETGPHVIVPKGVSNYPDHHRFYGFSSREHVLSLFRFYSKELSYDVDLCTVGSWVHLNRWTIYEYRGIDELYRVTRVRANHPDSQDG
jgi:hypothetical protein